MAVNTKGLMKPDYIRVMMQCPPPLHAWLDQQSQARGLDSLSEAAIQACEEAKRLGGHSAESLIASEYALHHAAELAEAWMFATGAEKERAMEQLVKQILASVRRAPPFNESAPRKYEGPY